MKNTSTTTKPAEEIKAGDVIVRKHRGKVTRYTAAGDAIVFRSGVEVSYRPALPTHLWSELNLMFDRGQSVRVEVER